MPVSLVDKTRRLLDASSLTYREIASGAGVGFEWLKSFSLGRLKEPGATRLERLHVFLANHPAPAPVPKRSQNVARAGNG